MLLSSSNRKYQPFPLLKFFSVVVCLRCLLHNILSCIAYTFRENWDFVLFMMGSLWWVQIVGYVMACRSYLFVCTLHHLIFMIVETYLQTWNLWNVCQIHFVECVSKIEHVLLVIHYSIYGAVCFQLTQFRRDGWENMLLCPIVIIKSEVWTTIHCLELGHETMVCAVCLFIFLWSCDMAGLRRGTFASWWYLPRIWPLVTDMQHYYHARYPTDDWHLACMFSLVYFSVLVCLVGVFPHSISMWSDPCFRACVPSWTGVSPHEKTISYKGWPSSPLEPSEGVFELMHGSTCIIGW